MRYLAAFPVAVGFLALGACKFDAVRVEVPAQIVDHTPESYSELQQVVSSALGGRSVTIAEDALTKKSLLVIEPKHLTGRDLRTVEQFRLVISGSTCVLVHLGSDARTELSRANCVAE